MFRWFRFTGWAMEGVLPGLIIVLGIPCFFSFLFFIAIYIGDLTGWYRLENYMSD